MNYKYIEHIIKKTTPILIPDKAIGINMVEKYNSYNMEYYIKVCWLEPIEG